MSTGTNVQIFDNTNDVFKYTGDWWTGGTWNASNGDSGTLSGTNDQNGRVTFTFPVAATAFRYFGMKRSQGGSYGICVDCDPSNEIFTTVDGFDPTDNGKNAPSALYSWSFSSPSVHIIIIRNQADPRGNPAGNSQLTLDRFELDVPVVPESTVTLSPSPAANTATTATQESQTHSTSGDTASPTGSTSRISSASGGPSLSFQSLTIGSSNGINQSKPTSTGPTSPSSTVSASSTTQASESPSTSLLSKGDSSTRIPLGGVIGGALGALAATSLLVVLLFWVRIRRRRRSSLPPGVTKDPVYPFRPTLIERTEPSLHRGGWITGYGAGAHDKGSEHLRDPQASFPSRPTDTSRSPGASSSARSLSDIIPAPALIETSRRRELDAGPVPLHLLDDNEDNFTTLPPDYGQVFNDYMSTRGSRFRQIPRLSTPPPLPVIL